ncbi:hypothetical protein PsorP6_006454 [Peronosclerospora sorghi]|uniref:Uncharacterized protein n=1 Tax=Peronosclerospora sorghi TaxID=230839 RepID=A0ACC0W4J7_9STRA|nr:hypothetical protein PsorP6_006454 [Peronosclerospora sorghi]
MRQQTLGEEDIIDVNLDVIEVQKDDTADIALLSEGEPLRLSNNLNPLSRLAMRRTEQPSDGKSDKTMSTSSTSTSTTPDLLDYPPPLIIKPPMWMQPNHSWI